MSRCCVCDYCNDEGINNDFFKEPSAYGIRKFAWSKNLKGFVCSKCQNSLYTTLVEFGYEDADDAKAYWNRPEDPQEELHDVGEPGVLGD